MGKSTLLAKLVGDTEICEWIYRFGTNPGLPRGGFLPPFPVLVPGPALGSRPRVALSSAQVPRVYLGALRPSKSLLGRRGHQLLPGLAPGIRHRELPFPFGPDWLLAACQPVRRCHVPDGAVQSHRIVVLDVLGDQPSRIFQT